MIDSKLIRRILALCLALLFAGPLLFLILSSLSAESEVVLAFFQYQALEVLIQTFGYGSLVALLACLIGGGWGYVCASYDFPLRRIWLWLLPAPLAIPVYVYAFVYLGIWTSIFEYSRPTWLLILLFAFAGSPYAYLLSFQAFRFEARDLREVSSLLGFTDREYFWKVRWPLARPLILASFFVVLTEFIADFGAVQIFGLRTFSTSIYEIWSSYLSFPSAALIALILLCGVAGILWLQSRILSFSFQSRSIERRRPKYAWALALAAGVYSLVSFIGPLLWLMIYNFRLGLAAEIRLESVVARPLLNTALMSFVFALTLTLLTGFLVFFAKRRDRFFPSLLQFGYALPGTLLAVAVTVPFFYLQRWFEGFSQTVAIGLALMSVAWSIRFLKVSWEPIAKSRAQMPTALEEAAELYEPQYIPRWRRLLFPMIKSGMVSSFLLLFIEAAKELPIALLTRPIGWDTLSIKVFQYTAESDWERAAGPALLITLLGCVGLALLLELIEEDGSSKNA